MDCRIREGDGKGNHQRTHVLRIYVPYLDGLPYSRGRCTTNSLRRRPPWQHPPHRPHTGHRFRQRWPPHVGPSATSSLPAHTRYSQILPLAGTDRAVRVETKSDIRASHTPHPDRVPVAGVQVGSSTRRPTGNRKTLHQSPHGSREPRRRRRRAMSRLGRARRPSDGPRDVTCVRTRTCNELASRTARRPDRPASGDRPTVHAASVRIYM